MSYHQIELDPKDPRVEDLWRHKNGNTYRVLFVTNLGKRSEEHPPQVVYAGAFGNVWSRPLSDWHRSMTLDYRPSNGA